MATSSGVFSVSKLAIVFALLCSLYLFRDIWLPSIPTYTDTVPPIAPNAIEHPRNHSVKPQDVDCLDAPGANRVMVVLKTGASEIYEKLPTHLLTLFRCTPHFLIFSDLTQNFSDYNVYDAIRTVRPEYKDLHADFEFYRKLQQYQREGQNVAKLKGSKSWDLDKYKFLPMMHEAYRLAPPQVDWFVYIEADTSLSWPNLLQFLGRMNPKKPTYLGAQNVVGYTTFAHGGSGFVISRGAAEKVEKKRQKKGEDKYDARWELATSQSCCGDEVVARALLEVGVKLTPSWPRIQGETVSTIDWTEKHWCTPAITWHHVSAAQVDAMWQFQTQWVKDNGWSKPYLYREVFDSFVSRHITVNRTSWNNLSNDKVYHAPTSESGQDTKDAFNALPDVAREGVKSFEKCAEACRAWGECVQWMFEPGICKLGKDVRLGESDERQATTWTSGWAQRRVQGMKDSLRDCEVNWDD